MKETWRRKLEGGSGARVWPGGEFPRGVDDWMETPARFWLCGLKRRALGRLRPAGPGLLSAVGPGSFERCGDLADAAEPGTRLSVEVGRAGEEERAAAALQTPPTPGARRFWNARLLCSPSAARSPCGEGFPPFWAAEQSGSKTQLRNLAAAGRTVLFRGWGVGTCGTSRGSTGCVVSLCRGSSRASEQ